MEHVVPMLAALLMVVNVACGEKKKEKKVYIDDPKTAEELQKTQEELEKTRQELDEANSRGEVQVNEKAAQRISEVEAQLDKKEQEKQEVIMKNQGLIAENEEMKTLVQRFEQDEHLTIKETITMTASRAETRVKRLEDAAAGKDDQIAEQKTRVEELQTLKTQLQKNIEAEYVKRVEALAENTATQSTVDQLKTVIDARASLDRLNEELADAKERYENIVATYNGELEKKNNLQFDLAVWQMQVAKLIDQTEADPALLDDEQFVDRLDILNQRVETGEQVIAKIDENVSELQAKKNQAEQNYEAAENEHEMQVTIVREAERKAQLQYENLTTKTTQEFATEKARLIRLDGEREALKRQLADAREYRGDLAEFEEEYVAMFGDQEEPMDEIKDEPQATKSDNNG